MSHLRANAETGRRIARGDQTRHMVPIQQRDLPAYEIDEAWLAKYGRHPWQVGQVLWLREPARVLDVRGRSALSREVLVEWPSNGLRAWRQWPARLGRDPIKDRGISNGCLREFARYECEVKSVGAQRFKDITEEEAQREGVDPGCYTRSPHGNPRYCYKTGLRDVLESIYGSPLPEWWWWWCTFETRRI